jgi:hypothetical protein
MGVYVSDELFIFLWRPKATLNLLLITARMVTHIAIANCTHTITAVDICSYTIYDLSNYSWFCFLSVCVYVCVLFGEYGLVAKLCKKVWALSLPLLRGSTTQPTFTTGWGP